MSEKSERTVYAEFYNTTRRYWTHQNTSIPEFLGVYPMGGGGLLEVLYRHHEELRHFKRIAPLSKDATLLELGCGNGRWVLSLARHLKYYEAVDFSDQMLALARRRAQAAGANNVQFFEATAQDHIPSRHFDVIYLSGVSGYLQDSDLADTVARMRQHLTPNGVIIERGTFHRRGRETVDFRESDQYASVYRTVDEISAIFKAAGMAECYRKESYRYMNFPPRVMAVLGRPRIESSITKLAPVSFPLLRIALELSNFFFGRRGEMNDYSHEFILFRPVSVGAALP